MAIDTFIDTLISFMFSWKGIALTLMLGLFIGLIMGINKFQKDKRFKNETLEEIVKKRIKKKAKLVGLTRNKKLMRGFDTIGFIIKTVKMPPTKIEWEEHKPTAKDKNKKVAVKRVIDFPESFVFITTKPGLFNILLGMLGLGIMNVIVQASDIKREHAKEVVLRDNMDFDYLGGTYVSNKLGVNYVRHMGELKMWEDSLEETANTIKRFAYYDRFYTMKIGLSEKKADIDKKKWDQARDDQVGGDEK